MLGGGRQTVNCTCGTRLAHHFFFFRWLSTHGCPAGRAVEVPDKVMWGGGSEMPVTDVSFMPPTPPRTHARPGRRSIHPWIGCLATVQPPCSALLFLAESSEISATSPHQTPRPRSARPDAPAPICQAAHAVPVPCENWKPGGMLCPLTSRKCNNK